MKKIALISFLFLFLGGVYFYLSHSLQSGKTIKREFLNQRPNTEFISAEMIFDWEPKRVYSYLVKYKHSSNNEVLLEEFAIKQNWVFNGNGAATKQKKSAIDLCKKLI